MTFFVLVQKKHFEGEILRNINILKTKICDSGPSPAVDKGCRGMILSYSRRGRTDGRIYLLISPTDNTTLIMQATLLEITAINAAGVFFVLPARFDWSDLNFIERWRGFSRFCIVHSHIFLNFWECWKIKASIAMNFNPAKTFRIHCNGTIKVDELQNRRWIYWLGWLNQWTKPNCPDSNNYILSALKKGIG